MKILLYSCHFEDPIGIGKFSLETAQGLVARGHEVRVIAAPSYYPEWRLSVGRWAMRYSIVEREGFSVVRCPIWVPRRPSGLARLLHYALFALTSLPAVLWWCLAWRPELVLVVSPPLMASPCGLLGAAVVQASTWLHVQDLEVDAAFELGLLKNQTLRRLLFCIERWLVSRFGVVSTISKAMAGRLEAKKLPVPKLFPNWVDTDAIFPLTETSPLRELLAPGARFVALYAGNLGRKQGIEMLFETAERLRDLTDVQIVICGEGVSRNDVVLAAKRFTNISVFPLRPLSELNALLNLADVHLLPQRSEVADLVMPSKLGGMLASGRPVIAAAPPQSQLALEIAGAGILVPPGDAEAMAQAIRTLRGAPQLRLRLGEGARCRALEHWSKSRILDDFVGQLQNMDVQ